MPVKMTPSNKEISRFIVLGILWAILEVFIGQWLKLWQSSLFAFNMPFLIAAFIVISKRLVPFVGSVLLMGIVAATVKLFFSGMVLHGAFMAILWEAFLAELTFLVLGYGFFSAVLVGILLQVYSLIHPTFSGGGLCQTRHFIRFNELLVAQGLVRDGAEKSTILIVLLVLHVVAGILAAVAGWFLGQWIFAKCCTENEKAEQE